MKVQQRHAFAGYTLPPEDRNVNWGIGESPIAPALSSREKPEDEVLGRGKGEMQTRAREIGAAEEAPVRTGGFRVPRLTGNCPTLTRLISRHSAIRHIRGFEGSSIPWIAIHTKKTSSLAHSYQG
jgi:hypothetical protein